MNQALLPGVNLHQPTSFHEPPPSGFLLLCQGCDARTGNLVADIFQQ